MWPYRILRSFLRLATRIFFRRIEVVGLEHVPENGAVIFCGNHPNSLLDPVLITCFCGRMVHFAAKDVLFRSRLLRVFLNIAGAVPVQRKKDHPDAVISNESAFAKLHEALAAGGTMGIFPEGISHDSAHLSKLKTGAARIAMGTQKDFPGTKVQIVACGLHYVHRHRFRSSVLIQFGPAVTISDDEQERFEAGDRDVAREVTTRLEDSLMGLTVNAEDWETLRVLDGVRRLYQPPRISLEDRVELARRFNHYYPTVKDEPAVIGLLDRVRQYLDRLAALGLTDRDLKRSIGPGESTLRIMRHLTLVLFWMPLAAVGVFPHLSVGMLLGWTGERFAPRKDVVATTKFLAGFLVLLALYVGVPLLVTVLFDIRAGISTLVLLPLSGYATLRVLERGQAVRRLAATSRRLFSLREELDALRTERDELEVAVLRAVDQFKPEGLELLFPHDVPAEAAE